MDTTTSAPSKSKTLKPHDPYDKLRDKFYRVMKTLLPFAVGQEEMMQALVLATVSRQHCLFIGPWGCNKTGLLEKYAHLVGANQRNLMMIRGEVATAEEEAAREIQKLSFTFTTTLSKYDQPEALLGPIDPNALRAGRWERQMHNTIADADFAYIGEIFSANASTLRAIVRVLNERVVESGGVPRKIRLRSVFADTNDEPVEAMLAVYDRFMIRYPVHYVPLTDRKAFVEMMKVGEWSQDTEAILSLADLDVATAASRSVTISEDFYEMLHNLRQQLAGDLKITLSDRRWVRSLPILRASAWLRGGGEVEAVDVYNVFRFTAFDRCADRDALLKKLEPFKAHATENREEQMMAEIREQYEDAVKQGVTEDDRMAVAMTLQQALGRLKNQQNLAECRRMQAQLDKMIEDSINDEFKT